MSTVHVSIGNTDNKLTQQEWSEFYAAVDEVVRHRAVVVHGAWVSPSTAPYQNAAWAIETYSQLRVRRAFKQELADLATRFGQDSIAWTEGETEFIPGQRTTDAGVPIGDAMLPRRRR
jgi:hypothetical protein